MFGRFTRLHWLFRFQSINLSMLTPSLADNPQVGRLEADHLAIPVHLAMNHAAYADNGALRQRFVVEAVEQQKLDSVPNAEGVTSSHRSAFGLRMMLPVIAKIDSQPSLIPGYS